jgi:hypothetical protein
MQLVSETAVRRRDYTGDILDKSPRDDRDVCGEEETRVPRLVDSVSLYEIVASGAAGWDSWAGAGGQEEVALAKTGALAAAIVEEAFVGSSQVEWL